MIDLETRKDNLDTMEDYHRLDVDCMNEQIGDPSCISCGGTGYAPTPVSWMRCHCRPVTDEERKAYYAGLERNKQVAIAQGRDCYSMTVEGWRNQ